MRPVSRRGGFTIAEMLISMAGSAVIIGALMFSAVSLQKAFRASELYAAAQADQRRLLDYLTRDLRRAVAIATCTSVNGAEATKAGATPIEVTGDTGLLLTLPGYYKSNAPENADFDEPLPVVVSDRQADYGSSTGLAPGVAVMFRKVFVAQEGCVCFVRQEADSQTIIVRNAADLRTRIALHPDGTSCVIEVWFTSPMGATRPLVSAHDVIMLRNNRID